MYGKFAFKTQTRFLKGPNEFSANENVAGSDVRKQNRLPRMATSPVVSKCNRPWFVFSACEKFNQFSLVITTTDERTDLRVIIFVVLLACQSAF